MSETAIADDLILGAENIGKEVGMSPRTIFYMAETGQLPIFKIGRKLAARRSALKRRIDELEHAAAETAVK